MSVSSTTDHAPPATSVDVTPQFGPQPSRTTDGSTDVRGGAIDLRDRILLLEGDTASRHTLQTWLREAGYEVTGSGSCRDGLRLAQETKPDVIVLDEELAELDCDLLAEVKGAASTAGARVILLVRGGLPERVRGLDLGADDVLSRPFEFLELQARIRVQLGLKKSEDELRDRLRIVEQSEQASRTAMVVTEKISREAFGLRRALNIGVLLVLMVLAAMSSFSYRFSRRISGDMQRNYAALAALNRNIANQQDLIERARNLRAQIKPTSATSGFEKQQEGLQRSNQVRAGMGQIPANSAGDLRQEVIQTEVRLKRLEEESSSAERIIRNYAPSVCLIHVAVGFRDASTGRSLRYATNSEGNPIQDFAGNPQLTLESTGPEFHMDVLGTGFLVGSDGRILTNRHIVQPWWNNDTFEEFTKKGLQLSTVEMTAYFPGSPQSYPLSVIQISSQADLALVLGPVEALNRKVLAVDGSEKATIRGDLIVLMGYATGLDAVLARLDDPTLQKVVGAGGGNTQRIFDLLAQKDLIRPLITQGHLGDVLPDQIVYDAQTAPGGSGGPVFNQDGKVIGVNHAFLEGFEGSNFGVPARFAEPLLRQ
jgi:CheY-like chemotaxis protein/S1-C subfamily serine protease